MADFDAQVRMPIASGTARFWSPWGRVLLLLHPPGAEAEAAGWTLVDVTAESVIRVYQKREEVGGLQFTYEPETLRFFQARFEPV